MTRQEAIKLQEDLLRLVVEVNSMESARILELCILDMQKFIKVLKGEERDLTGLGLWRIISNKLQRAMNCRIITEDQWINFTKGEK